MTILSVAGCLALGAVRLLHVGTQPSIPGAVRVDLDADLAAQPGQGGRHPIPDDVALQTLWRRCEIGANMPVVCLDSSDGALAARAWWLLRYCGHRQVHLLDGGVSSWQRAGCPEIESAGPASDFQVHTPGMPMVTTPQVATCGQSGLTVLDARSAARYRGEVEPLDGVPGRIPGAVNLPYLSLQDADGTVLSAADLRAAFAAVGVAGAGDVAVSAGVADVAERACAGDVAVSAGVADVAERAAVSCGSGVSACYVIAAGQQIGLELALYPGSYSGWLAAGMPIETG